jgi:hypothetical protein
MNFWDWFPILLWPITLLYALLCTLIVWRAVNSSAARQSVAAFLALPAIAIEKYLIDNSSQSLVLLFDFYFAFVVAGAFCCTAFLFAYVSKAAIEKRMGAMILFALLGPFLLFLGANILIQDYALSRFVVEGIVGDLNVETSSKKAAEYQVTIGTKIFWAAPQTFDSLKVGDRVRAEIGKGSQYIFKIERIPGTG